MVLLAATLGLASADTAMVGATAAGLERAFGIGTVQIGLLATVTSAVSAVATVPAGMLVDRGHDRSHILGVAAALWSVALAIGGAATSYHMLLLSRVGLGIMSAVAGPAVASMTGSYFSLGRRGSAYGVLLAGELVGAGAGLLTGGILSSVTTWRSGWFLLAAVGMGAAVAIWRLLPDPGITDAADAHDQSRPTDRQIDRQTATRGARASLPEPDPARVLRRDPTRMPSWSAIRYLLSIRSNVVLILASSLGYFFFAGLRTFSFLLLRSHYHLDSLAVVAVVAVIGLAAIGGVVVGGRFGDGLLRSGMPAGRMLVAGVGFVSTAILMSLALAFATIWAAVVPFALAMAGLGAANPSLDAARLDVVVPGLRGRAEGLRTVCRSVGEAAAPLTMGLIASALGATSLRARTGTTTTGSALAVTFLLAQGLLLCAGLLILVLGRRSYPGDVAAAIASATRHGEAVRDPQVGIE